MHDKWDVISFDVVGQPFDGYTPELTGLGGSESQDILVLEALAAKGYRVLSLNRLPSPAIVNGVRYEPMAPALQGEVHTKHLILQRTTSMPENIKADHVFVRAQDIYSEFSGYDVHEELFARDQKPTLVCLSKWQAKAFPAHWPKVVIPNMIPDWVYAEDRRKPRNAPAHSFLYASAVIKGLQETLKFFGSMRERPEFKNATLDVCCPAYSAPSGIELPGVRYLGSLGFRQLVAAYQEHRHLLHVSVFPETYGIAHVLSETLGLNPLVLQLHGGDALPEVLNSKTVTRDLAAFNAIMGQVAKDPQSLNPASPHNFQVSHVMEQWLNLLSK